MAGEMETLALGVMTSVREDPLAAFSRVKEFGFDTCQLGSPPDEYIYGPNAVQMTDKVKAAIAETGVRVTSVFIGFKGHVWNCVDGPRTIGFVPPDTRAVRAVHACRVSNWARDLGLDAVTSHVGFIPEDPQDPLYAPLVEFLRTFISYCGDNGQRFAFETGQESPRTLRRTIDDIGLDNAGVNLDPANLLLYGKGKPLDAVEVFGELVLNTHCKDGKWPTEEGKLGKEYPLGEGDVDFETLLPALYAKGFRGPLTIEREISGPKQAEDIMRGAEFLKKIRAELLGRSA